MTPTHVADRLAVELSSPAIATEPNLDLGSNTYCGFIVFRIVFRGFRGSPTNLHVLEHLLFKSKFLNIVFPNLGKHVM